MKFLSHSGKEDGTAVYESTYTARSATMPGVTFTVLKLSFARRIELARRVLDLSRRLEFAAAGNGVEDSIEANLLASEIDRIYLEWGLAAVEGLLVDGAPATAEALAEKGPEPLAREIVAAVKAQCGLSEEERKN